jgi:hypothetical protein
MLSVIMVNDVAPKKIGVLGLSNPPVVIVKVVVEVVLAPGFELVRFTLGQIFSRLLVRLESSVL